MKFLNQILYCIFINLWIYISISNGHLSSRLCEPLSRNLNIKVECKVPGNSSINDCSTPQAVGTIANYGCKIYYTPFDSLKQGTLNSPLKCDKSGKWIGIRAYQTFRCKEECGTIVRNADPLVVNGQLSSKYLHPWHASVFRKKGDGNTWEFICGGSLIRNQIVLSAAHCFAFSNTAVNEPNDFRIVLGAISNEYTENAEKDSGAKIFSVHRLYISENYDPKKGYQADIALIHLKENVEFSDYILPICLPNDYKVDVNAIKNGVQGEIAGFGVTETGKISRRLRSIHLTVRSNSECHNSLQRVLTESQYCAGGKKDNSWKTVCNGDSGGGMTFLSEAEDLFYIHGIVSSGDAKNKEICQNYAVFTRVYPFVFWIRSVIEEISGEIARESRLNVPYPYTLSGTELEMVEFTGLPREWENRVTTFTAQHVSINPEVLLESLNFAKPMQSLNISDSKLEAIERLAKKRAILPYLTSFYIDVFDDVTNHGQNFNESFISSLLFFYKTYDNKDWKLENIPSLETNIDVVVNINKILHYNKELGELSIFGLPSAHQIIRNARLSPDFHLSSLLLKNCENIPVIDIVSTRTLQTLILDNVQLSNFTPNAFVWIKNFKKLEVFVLNPENEEISLTLDIIPPSVKHVSLSSKVYLQGEAVVNRDNIFFPDEEISTFKRFGFKKVETFCCISCKMDEFVEINLYNLFPNVENLVIESDLDISSSIQEFLEESNTLKFLYVQNTLTNATVVMRRALTSKRWVPSDKSFKTYQGIVYRCTGQKNFWTSKEEYLVQKRLKTFEKDAVATKVYQFNGNSNQRFQGIPLEIQEDIEQIILNNVEVTPRVLLNSVSKAPKLVSLVMNNVSVIGSGWRSSFQTGDERIEFKIESVPFLNFTFEYVFKLVNGARVSTVIPFQDLGRFKNSNYSNTLHRLFGDVNSIVIDKVEGATAYSYNSFVREMTYNGLHILNAIKNVGPDHPLQEFLPFLAELRGLYKSDILPPDWKFIGVHSFNKKLFETFFKDSITQFIGNLGVFQLVLKRFGKYLSLANLSLTGLKEGAHYPPIQAIAISLIKNFEL